MGNRTIQLSVLKSLLRKFTSCFPTQGLFLCAGWRGSLNQVVADMRNLLFAILIAPALYFQTIQAETEGQDSLRAIPVGSRLKKTTIQFKSGATFDNFASPRLRRLPVRFAQECRYQSGSDSLQQARPANCCLTGWFRKPDGKDRPQ